MERRYLIADVFTDAPYGGNPLAVYLDADGLSPAQMQAIAREMNLSETTFVTPGSAAGRWRVRIFTPAAEIPFAGHPTIGTAVVLAETGAASGLAEIVLEETVGPVRVALRPGRATLFMDGAPKRHPDLLTPAAIAGMLGVPAAALVATPFVAGYGVPVVYVQLADRAAVSAASGAGWNVAATAGVDPYVFAEIERGAGHVHVHARLFAPAFGIPEDPATGSAAATLAGSIATGLADGEFHMTIDQGIEMGRPSRIDTTTRMAGGAVAGVSVGGGAVIVAEARLLRLP